LSSLTATGCITIDNWSARRAVNIFIQVNNVALVGSFGLPFAISFLCFCLCSRSRSRSIQSLFTGQVLYAGVYLPALQLFTEVSIIRSLSALLCLFISRPGPKATATAASATPATPATSTVAVERTGGYIFTRRLFYAVSNKLPASIISASLAAKNTRPTP